MNYGSIFNNIETQKLANTICELARECWQLRLSDSTGFSISARVPGTDAILVDKSGTGFRRNRISPNDLLLMNDSGELLYLPEGSNNDRLAPVNVAIHLAGYKASNKLTGCIHWHDQIINAFTGKGLSIEPYTLQSKLLGTIECITIDDSFEKAIYLKLNEKISVPSGFHPRDDVYYSMKKVADAAGDIINKRVTEFDKHGISLTHKQHGIFSWGRSVEEAFDNAYRVRRNAESILWSKLL